MDKRNCSLLLLIPAIIVIFGNGCGEIGFNVESQNFSSELDSSGGGICESELKKVYGKTYHPFLASTCNQCHRDTHGSIDLEVSYSAFKQRGVSQIDSRAVTAHGGNSLGPQIQPQINAFKPLWNEGQDAYVDCKSKEGADGPQVSNILLGNKKILALPTLKAAQVVPDWMTVIWDLEVDMPVGASAYPFSLSLDVRTAIIDGRPQGLQFRNPSVKLKSANAAFLIEGLQLLVNDQLLANVSTYFNLAQTTYMTSAFQNLAPLSADALYYNENLQLPFDLSIIILNLTATGSAVPPTATTLPVTTTTLPLPARITYADLMGSDPNLNVFKSCNSCHSAANPRGNLDITMFNSANGVGGANDKSAKIFDRIRGIGNIMPQSGKLPQRRIDLVSLWISLGKPQN